MYKCVEDKVEDGVEDKLSSTPGLLGMSRSITGSKKSAINTFDSFHAWKRQCLCIETPVSISFHAWKRQCLCIETPVSIYGNGSVHAWILEYLSMDTGVPYEGTVVPTVGNCLFSIRSTGKLSIEE